MISQIVRRNLLEALELPPGAVRFKWLLRNRAEIGPQHRKWIINPTPKFYLQLHGATRLQYPGGTLKLNKHNVLFMAPHIPHHETKINDDREYTALVINFLTGRMQLIISGKGEWARKQHISDRDYADNAFRPVALELLRLLTFEGQSLPEKVLRQLLESFLNIANSAYRQSAGSEEVTRPPVIAGALQIISEHISDSSLTVSQLARQLGCSSEHLSRVFSHSMAISLKGYLMRQRLQLSADILLSQPSETVNAIAYMSGFSSPGYFCTSFKKQYGVSPAKFRQKHCT